MAEAAFPSYSSIVSPQAKAAESQQLAREMAVGVAQTAAAALVPLYILYTFAHHFILPAPIAVWMVPLAGATAVLLPLLRRRLLQMRQLQTHLAVAHWAGGAVSTAVLVNSAAILWLTGDPLQITNLILLVVGNGLLLFSRRLYIGITVASVGAALIPLFWLPRPLAPEWLHFGFAMTAGLVLSGVVFAGKEWLIGRLAGSHLEERSRQAALNLNEHRYRQVFDHSPGLLCLHDLNGRLLAVNQAGAEALGYTTDQVVGRYLHEFLGDLNDPSMTAPYLSAIAAKGRAEGLMAVRMRSGAVRQLSFRNSLYFTETGEPRVVGSATDVTEILEARAALEAAKADLEHRVIERTSALATSNAHLEQELRDRAAAEERRQTLEVQLRQAQKLESLGLLASGIAHDFNNILMLIQGSAEFALESRDLPEALREKLTEVMASSERGRSLVQQILSFGRPGAGDRLPTAVADAVADAVHFLRASLPASIAVHYDLDAGNPTIIVDPIQLQQVLVNLGTNAAHAMPRGGTLTIRARCTHAPLALLDGAAAQPVVEIAVEDTGSGIAEEHLERLFDPFFTTKAPGKGTGLGLSVVHGIVTAHGGRITVRSTLGVGTTFAVLLPLADQGGNAELSPSTTSDVRVTSADFTGTERILVVDDERQITNVLDLYLAKRGYRIVQASSAADALELLQSEDVDLIVTDHNMPGLSGAEFAVQVRATHPALPLLLMSGDHSAIDRVQIEQLGRIQLISKPFKLRDLARHIREMLDSTGAACPMSFDDRY